MAPPVGSPALLSRPSIAPPPAARRLHGEGGAPREGLRVAESRTVSTSIINEVDSRERHAGRAVESPMRASVAAPLARGVA